MNELLRRLLCLPEQASSAARGVDTLHYFVIGAAMLGAVAVFAIAILFVILYRQRDDVDPGAVLTPRTRTPMLVEGGLIAGTLGLFLLFWVVGFRQYVDMHSPPADALEIYVTGKQWMWKFAYPGGRSSIGVLAVPVGRPVRLVMTSRDVIHSFYVPAFRLKQDVVPGRYLSMWFQAERPGTYDVFCAEYCGLSHSRMRAAVVAMPMAEYEAWLEHNAAREDDDDAASGAAPPGGRTALERAEGMADFGRRVAVRRGCLACHSVDGQPHIGPSWRNLLGSTVTLADGRTVEADEAYLTRSMMNPMADLVAGYAPVMPTYQGVLDGPESAALVEYIRSLRGAGVPPVALPRIAPSAIVPANDGGVVPAEPGAQPSPPPNAPPIAPAPAATAPPIAPAATAVPADASAAPTPATAPQPTTSRDTGSRAPW